MNATTTTIEPITIAELKELLSTREVCSEDGPVELLTALLNTAAAVHTESGTLDAAMEYVASKGLGWDGGYEGAIAVDVRDFGDGEPECRWTSTDGTWCCLRELVDAIRDGNAVPDWYEDGWINVQVTPGNWVDRNAIAAGYIV